MTESSDSEIGSGPKEDSLFPIVGIGASAGGIEAFKQMLRALPEDTGMAFVLILHLDPTHTSILAEIMSTETSMPVSQVKGEEPVEQNHVYIIPPGMDMIIQHGALQLTKRTQGRGKQRSIDQFLRSLAEDKSDKAIGVILSGSASDGSLGLEEIKAAGGITFAQDHTAQHDSMPRSAIDAGCVDFVLPPERIAEEITRIARHPYVNLPPPPEEPEPVSGEPTINRVLQILRKGTGVDFTNYKFNTLYRRITRRMVLNKMESLRDYTYFLEHNAAEIDSLYHDVLISVTGFFRNPEAFQTLKVKAFPRLLKNRSRHDPLRIWVLGCSTGEEAYSVAISITEFLQEANNLLTGQIFATDLSGASIERARAGIYTKDIVEDVSPERLGRFFVEVDGFYRVSKQIRDMCVFARHNALSDPPFSRIDLISCRNLLIYLEPVLQQRIIPVLHYALKPNGILWLGASETIGSYHDYFDVEDGKHKIYLKKVVPHRSAVPLPVGAQSSASAPVLHDSGHKEMIVTASNVQKEADRLLLAKYSPPGVLINSDLEILQFRGETGAYLTPAPGKASLNLLKMAREGLLVALRGAIHKAKREEVPVREEGLSVKTNGSYRDTDIEVIPIKGIDVQELSFLVLFEDTKTGAGSRPRLKESETASPVQSEQQNSENQIVRLTQELAATREYLQSVIEQQEAANEELQSANEEVQSANEELQSINEELETSKEEIQSANEELATVNDELNSRNIELSQSNNDLLNLIRSVGLPIVILGQDLRIRRFTPAAEKMLNLIPTDVGRPISDIKLNVDVADLEQLLIDAIDTVSVKERDVRDNLGRWYLLRIRPYRTSDNRVEGAVIILLDIDTLKRNQESLRRQAGLLEQTHDAIFMWELGGTITYWNRGAEMLYGFSKDQAIGRVSAELLSTTLYHSPGRSLEEALEPTGVWSGELKQRTSDGIEIIVESRAVVLEEKESRMVLETNRDVTARKRLEENLRQRIQELATADRQKDDFVVMLAHELRNPLAPIQNAAQILRVPDVDQETASRAHDVLDRQIDHMTRMIDDLLDISRIAQGKVRLRFEVADLTEIVKETVAISRPHFEARRQQLSIETPAQPIYINADTTRLEQVLNNLLNNASKFSDQGGHIWLSVETLPAAAGIRKQKAGKGKHETGGASGSRGRQAVISVRDDGMGISEEMLPHVFDLFAQADRSLDRSQGGLGIGLTMVRRLVDLHGGTVEARSDGPQRGSEFIIRLPLYNGAGLEPESGLSEDAAVTEPGKCRILVVDDNIDAAQSLATLLQLAGHEIRSAYDGPTAVDTATEFLPQVVLLDIGLPIMSGYEVARQLRQRPGMEKALIIALTGYGRDEDRRRARDAQFDEYLIKPIDHDALCELLARRFPKAHL